MGFGMKMAKPSLSSSECDGGMVYVMCKCVCVCSKHFESIQFFRVVINLVKFYIVVGCCCCCCRCWWCWCWCCVFLFSILLCGMAADAAAVAADATAVFESFALCFLPLFYTYARSRVSSSNMVQSQNNRIVHISSRRRFFAVVTSAWPDWTVIFNANRFFRVCVCVCASHC